MTQKWEPRIVHGLPDGVIFFDGVCVFCSWWVRRILERDDAGRFCFAPLQSGYGRAAAPALGIDPENPETNAAVLGGRAYFKSDAALRVLALLPGWSWVAVCEHVPRALRDWLYDRIARNRYDWFGKMPSCMVPPAGMAARFIGECPPAEWRRP